MIPLITLNNSDLFKSFKIDLRSFYKNRVYIQNHLHIQPSEIDSLCYYEYQWMIIDTISMLQEQNGKGDNNQQQTQTEFVDKITSQSKSMMSSIKMPKL